MKPEIKQILDLLDKGREVEIDLFYADGTPECYTWTFAVLDEEGIETEEAQVVPITPYFEEMWGAGWLAYRPYQFYDEWGGVVGDGCDIVLTDAGKQALAAAAERGGTA